MIPTPVLEMVVLPTTVAAVVDETVCEPRVGGLGPICTGVNCAHAVDTLVTMATIHVAIVAVIRTARTCTHERSADCVTYFDEWSHDTRSE